MKKTPQEKTPQEETPAVAAPEVNTVKMVKPREEVGDQGPAELDVLPHNVQQHIEAGWKIKE